MIPIIRKTFFSSPITMATLDRELYQEDELAPEGVVLSDEVETDVPQEIVIATIREELVALKEQQDELLSRKRRTPGAVVPVRADVGRRINHLELLLQNQPA